MNAHQSVRSDRRESSDTYSAEIYRLGDWRVILCKAGIQWVLQARTRAGGPAGARWEGRHYCRQRETVLRLWRALAGDEGAMLAAVLPERFGQT